MPFVICLGSILPCETIRPLLGATFALPLTGPSEATLGFGFRWSCSGLGSVAGNRCSALSTVIAAATAAAD